MVGEVALDVGQDAIGARAGEMQLDAVLAREQQGAGFRRGDLERLDEAAGAVIGQRQVQPESVMRRTFGMMQGLVHHGDGPARLDMEAEDQAGAAIENGTGFTHGRCLARWDESSVTALSARDFGRPGKSARRCAHMCMSDGATNPAGKRPALRHAGRHSPQVPRR